MSEKQHKAGEFEECGRDIVQFYRDMGANELADLMLAHQRKWDAFVETAKKSLGKGIPCKAQFEDLTMDPRIDALYKEVSQKFRGMDTDIFQFFADRLNEGYEADEIWTEFLEIKKVMDEREVGLKEAKAYREGIKDGAAKMAGDIIAKIRDMCGGTGKPSA